MTRHTDNQVWSPVSDNDNDQEFPHNYWDFKPAACNTPVAMAIRRTSTRKQEELAEELATFIQQDTVNFARLNADLRPATWVVLVPGSTHRLRVLYGVASGYGVGGLTDESLDSSIIGIHGERDPPLTAPSAMVINGESLRFRTVKVPTTNEFDDLRLRHTVTDKAKPGHWFSTKNLTASISLPCILPIPSYIVSDGIHSDINAVVVYERALYISSLPDVHCPTAIKLLLELCKTSVVKYNTKEKSPHIPIEDFLASPSMSAQRWGQT